MSAAVLSSGSLCGERVQSWSHLHALHAAYEVFSGVRYLVTSNCKFMDLLYAESCAQPAADLILATSAVVQ